MTSQAVEKHQAVTGDNIEGKKEISEDRSDKSNGKVDESVSNWEHFSRVEEERSHDERGDDGIIQASPVPAVQPVNKIDAAQNWIDKTW